MKLDEAVDTTVGSTEGGPGWHVDDIPFPAPPLWGEQPGAFWKERSETSWPVLCHDRAGVGANYFSMCKGLFS